MATGSCVVKVWVRKPQSIVLVVAPPLNLEIGAQSVSYYGRTRGTMHSRVTRRARRPRDDEGAVAILMALCMGILLVVAALVLDFGLVRVDRQVDKSAADAATVAGLHALNTGEGKAHPYIGVCTAVRYLQRNAPASAG